MIKLFSTLLIGLLFPFSLASSENVLRAGAASVDFSPRTLPAIRNGGFLEATAAQVADPLHARCLVLSDGKQTIAITIVDSCMFPTDICDAIKSRVTEKIGLPADRILISATHTHSAPSVMAYCLGTRGDHAYTEYVVPRVAEAIVLAHENLQPAKIGWTTVDAGEQTNCRRWITRSDRMGTDSFGQRTVRAMMHPGYLNPDDISPAGPIDPQLSLLCVVATVDDTPLCLLANFSMHYFGGSGFPTDYFGEVAGRLEAGIAEAADQTPRHFVGIMSQGTSGDLHWMDYGRPRQRVDRTEYAETLGDMVVDQAVDATGQHPAYFDGGVALYLSGPDQQELDPPSDSTTAKQSSANRCVYFAGGSLQANVAELPAHYSLSIVSTEEGLPVLAMRSGAAAQEQSEQHVGATPLVTTAWHHVAVVRDADGVKIFLDGKAQPEIAASLASITDKRAATLLANIMDPSAEVEARYLTYIVVTVDGRVHNGLLATETGSSITLLSNDGKRETILRTEMEELRASGKSLMPEGLENDLTPQAVADLIAWLTEKPATNPE